MGPASIVKFRVAFVSRDIPDDARVADLSRWCVRFNETGLTPQLEGAGRSHGNLSFRIRPNDPFFVITASMLPSKQDIALWQLRHRVQVRSGTQDRMCGGGEESIE